jgi:ERCC4-type nuclease
MSISIDNHITHYSKTADMLIKIDCREKDLLEIMKPVTPAPAPVPSAPAVPEPAEPDHYIMDLGDGVTMKVPLPKNKTTTKATPKPKLKPTPKSLGVSIINHEIRSERLPIGDIILYDPRQGQQKDIVIFERKTLSDLAASIRDGRYKEQSFRLIETAAARGFNTHHIIYIIEGDLARYDERHTQITKTALQSAIVSLLYYKGFSVIRTMNVGETADFILHFADKVTKEGPLFIADMTTTATAYSEVSTKKEKRDYITRENIGEIMLAQVPGVSAKMASAILAKYNGSLYEFLGDLHRKIAVYEESVSPEMSPPSPSPVVLASDSIEPVEPMNKNKYKHVSECFKGVTVVTVDGKRGIGKATVEKVCFFLG